MSKLTDKISYLQGMAEGMKLNPDEGANRLIQGILDVLGEIGTSFDALAEAHGELSEYVDSIDEDLADLEADLYDEEDADDAYEGDEDDDEEDIDLNGALLYECPHCHETVEPDPEELDLEEEHPCPVCGQELFPELPEEVD